MSNGNAIVQERPTVMRSKPCRRGFLRQMIAGLAAWALLLAPVAQAERTHLKPGWNFYSPAQDVEIGRQASQQAEKQIRLLNDRRVDDYLTNLGRRLAAKAPGERYPYQFHCVNDRVLNAFALPGGYLYVNRGIIEAADNEAQLAGVMGHEIGHVALRHGTNQATKAQGASVGLGILGALLGGGVAGSLAGVGAQLFASGVLLKYSRDAERQADIIGTQILYDMNMDPRAMAQFFEKLEAQSKGGRPPEFFSDHPNPENRMERVMEEVQKLGGPPPGYKTDSAEFREIKKYLLSLPAPPNKGGRPTSGGGSGGSNDRSGRPAMPSENYQSFRNDHLQLIHPENWRANQQGDGAAFVPDGGVVRDSSGNDSLAYGVIVSLYEPHNDRAGQQVTLEEATDQFVEEMRHTNPHMRVTRSHETIRVGGGRALSVYLSNDSPLGGRETDRLVTVLRPEGLLYLLCVAEERDFGEYDRAFQAMLDSVRFVRR